MGKSIIKATGVILVMNMVVKLLGFFRDTFLANAFGATDLSDSYLIGYTIPYFLQAILGFAMVTAVVPILTKYLVAGKKEEAWEVGSGIINITALILTVITAIGMLITPLLVRIMAPGFETEQAQLTASLTRVMFPSVVFMGVGMVLTGICNASYRFAVSAFAPGFSNIVVIFAIMFFAGAYGVFGVAVGTLISFIGFFLVQIPVLWQMGFKYKLTLGLHHPDIRQMLKNILPIVLGVAVNQIYFALNRIFASMLADGTISALNYSNKLLMLPIGIFVAAVANAIYPTLSEMALQGNKGKMSSTLKRGLGNVCLIAVPAAVGLAVLAGPIIQLIFERGMFDHGATLATANALLFSTIGLVPMSANMVLTRAFYSLGDVKTPVKIGMYSIVINLILSFTLFKLIPYGGGGLALANSLAALVGTLWMYYHLKHKSLKELNQGNLLKSILKMGVAALVMALAVWGFKFALLQFGLDLASSKGALLLTAGGVIIGMAVYAIAIFALKVDETKYFLDIVKRKLKKS